MTNSSTFAVASLAAALTLVVGCDSSNGGQEAHSAHSAEATCARFTACGLGADSDGSQDISFSECLSYLGLAAKFTDAVDTEAKVAFAVIDCILAASNCDELRACVNATPSQAAVCDTTNSSTCVGDVIVHCDTKNTQTVTKTDCAKLGLVCGTGAAGHAMCGKATCDPASTPPTCDGDLLVTCDVNGNVLVSRDCRLEGQSCRANSVGQNACVGTTECNDRSNQCDGTTMVRCDGSTFTETRHDCAKYDSGMTCRKEETEWHGGSISTMNCVPIAPECISGAESCKDGVIRYCNSSGKLTTYDCRSIGLSGCATTTQDSSTHTGCVL